MPRRARTLSGHEQRFCARIRAVRAVRKLSQQDLAVATGLHRSGYAAVEAGTRRASLDDAIRIAAALDVALAALYGVAPVEVTTTIVVP